MLFAGMSGCIWYRKNIEVGGYDCSSLEDSRIFSGKSEIARVEEFTHYDVEKQYAVFICGMEYTYSRAFEFLKAFALEGRKVISFVKARLIETHDDRTIHDIVSLLYEMQWVKSYDVAGDEELMRYAHERVQGMQDGLLKRSAKEYLMKIRQIQQQRPQSHPN
jgi:hypothetical protein